MGTMVGVVGKSEGIPQECNLNCDECQITSKIVAWLTSLYSLHANTRIIDFKFTTNHDQRDNMGCCIHMVAQLEWKN